MNIEARMETRKFLIYTFPGHLQNVLTFNPRCLENRLNVAQTFREIFLLTFSVYLMTIVEICEHFNV